MLCYSIMQPAGILIIRPNAPLSKDDFRDLRVEVDRYLEIHTKLHGVLIQAKVFPGWENLGGFRAHIEFVRSHRDQIERIAVVTDSPIARIAALFAKHAISAQFMRFPFTQYLEAIHWLQAD